MNTVRQACRVEECPCVIFLPAVYRWGVYKKHSTRTTKHIKKGQTACWYCERTYDAKFRHRVKYEIRRQFIKMMKDDLDLQREFTDARKEMIDQLSSGRARQVSTGLSLFMAFP